MAAEQTFFLTMTEQVSAWVPDIRGGMIELPEQPIAGLVDWRRIARLAP
jgi:hypothetical protein